MTGGRYSDRGAHHSNVSICSELVTGICTLPSATLLLASIIDWCTPITITIGPGTGLSMDRSNAAFSATRF